MEISQIIKNKKYIVVGIFVIALLVSLGLVLFYNNKLRKIKRQFDDFDQEKVEEKKSEINEILSADTDYFDSAWNWENNMVEALVVEVNSVDEDFLLNFKRPTDKKFSGITKLVGNVCPPDNTIAVTSVNPTASDVGADFQISSKAEKGDLIIAYCNDPECMSIGKKCYLVKFID